MVGEGAFRWHAGEGTGEFGQVTSCAAATNQRGRDLEKLLRGCI